MIRMEILYTRNQFPIFPDLLEQIGDPRLPIDRINNESRDNFQTN